MFTHNFKYTLKTLVRKKSLIFWAFAFPIILGLFFNMAFSDIEKQEKLDIINLAVIDNVEFQENVYLSEVIKSLSLEGNDQLFNTQYVSSDKATSLLLDKEISGIIEVVDQETKITINTNGVNETIIKNVVDEIESKRKVFDNIIKKQILESDGDITSIIAATKEKIMQDTANIKDVTEKNMSYVMVEFYTLIAMACLYGGMIGMSAINQSLANMSNKGRRIEISPIKRTSVILSSVLASFLVEIVGISILLLFLIFGLKIDFGSSTALVILLSIVGSLAGLSMGIAVSSIFKTNENNKMGIILSVTMFFSFLSGMMGITMKYVIDSNIPFLNLINPVNMITDGFYALYHFKTYDRFYFNLISLLIFSGIMILLSVIKLRRPKYDSI